MSLTGQSRYLFDRQGKIVSLLKRWYFTVNDRGLLNAKNQIEVAVRSAQNNTELEPFCIYAGNDEKNISWLKSLGVSVIIHEASFSDAMRIGYGDKYRIFSGHWLRVDIPIIEDKYEHILYTDIDVLFMKHPVPDNLPDLLGVVTEERNGGEMFNNGVMVMNIPALREDHKAFVSAIRKRMLNNFTYPAHDQASYNRFYRRRHSEIDRGFNWRPYWGKNDQASIIHFHGPKPDQAEDLERGRGKKISQVLIDLWRQNPEAYKFYGSVCRKVVPDSYLR